MKHVGLGMVAMLPVAMFLQDTMEYGIVHAVLIAVVIVGIMAAMYFLIEWDLKRQGY